MMRISSLLILLVVLALMGKTAVTAFCPDLLPVSMAACDWAEESQEEDGSEEDDKAFHPNASAFGSNIVDTSPAIHPAGSLTILIREILAPPPQV